MEHKCPLCGKESESGLAAERNLSALVEAGRVMRYVFTVQQEDREAWDNAVAAIKEGA